MGHSPRGFEPVGTELRRLVDGGATAKERLLLQAGIQESPPNDTGRRRTLAALGIAVGASTVTSTAAAAAGVLTKGAPLAPAKWLVLGAVSAAVAAGSVELASKADSAPALASTVAGLGRKAAAASTSPSPVQSALPRASSPSLPSRPVTPYAAQNSPRAAPALSLGPSPEQALRPLPLPSVRAPGGTAAAEAISPAELVEQVAALDRARAALRAGRVDESVALLDRFDRSYPRSSLAPEATVVRVSALLALGQRTRATELVRAYCQTGGRGAYGHRLMKLVGLSETACEGHGP